MELNEQYLIAALRAALAGEPLPERPADLDLEAFRALAARQGVGQILDDAQKHRAASLKRKRAREPQEREVQERLSKAGVKVLPIRDSLYAGVDYRPMEDLVFLVGQGQGESARVVLKAMGFQEELPEEHSYDVYVRPPFLRVKLFREAAAGSPLRDSVSHIWARALPDPVRENCYYLPWDDCYLFLLSQFAGRYYSGGGDIRSVLDIHMFLQAHRQDLRPSYLERELTALRLLEFHATAERLAESWFGQAAPDEAAQAMGSYLLTSSGTRRRCIESALAALEVETGSAFWARVCYVHRRTFLDYWSMCDQYPTLRRRPVLLPAFWVCRLGSALRGRRAAIQQELSVVCSKPQRHSAAEVWVWSASA